MKFFNRSKPSTKNASGKRTEGKSLFRRINDWLHLWLGLISGIIVLIVCITGCIWVFNEEITTLLEPETRIEKQDSPVLAPSVIRQIAAKAYPGQKVTFAEYQQGKVVEVGAGDYDKEHYSLKMNPYTGEIVSRETHLKGEYDFFRWVLNGHRFLWMPYEIGRPIVNYGTMIFVVLLITGLIWWYPKKWTKSTVDKSFKIKWNGTFKRINLDLHNVLGFYGMLFLLAIALTGMVWGIEWYSKGLYWATSGGDTLPKYANHSSDSLQANKHFTADQAMDKAWNKVLAAHPETKGFYYGFPDTTDAKSAIYIYIYPSVGQFYNSLSYAFDRHTLKEFPKTGVYDQQFAGAKFGVQLRKMNYDIHVGSILGFPGKVLAFLSSLIGASLPVTGFIIWWNRKGFGNSKKKSKKHSSHKRERYAKETSRQPTASGGSPKPKFKPRTQNPKEQPSLLAIERGQNPSI